MASTTQAQKLYEAVKAGRVKLQDLNEEGKQTLREYLQTKNRTPKMEEDPVVNGVQNQMAASPSPRKRDDGFSFVGDVIRPAENFLLRASNAANRVLFGPVHEQYQQRLQQSDTAAPKFQEAATPADTTAERVADVTGSLLGYAAPVGGAYATGGRLAQRGYQTVTRGIQPATRAGRAAKKLGERAATGAAAGTTFSAAMEARDVAVEPGEQTLGERIQDIGDEALVGATVDAATYGLARGLRPLGRKAREAIKSGRNRVKGSQQQETTKTLAQNVADDEYKQVINEIDTELAGTKRGKEVANKVVETVDVEGLRDRSLAAYNFKDVYRNFRQVFGQNYDKVKKTVLDPFDKAKEQNIDFQTDWLQKLKDEVVNKLGITRGSRKSALVQQYGEGKISLDELKEQRPNDWQDIVKADEWFRKAYDQLLDQVNTIRKEIYPNNPDKLVPKRKDYYRHFRELEGLQGLRNLFETPSQIDPSLAGVSEFTRPQSRFHGFMQRRGLGPYKNDAVGGFLDYLPSASYAIHIDPQIPVFRQLAKSLAEKTEKSRNLNNFIHFLHNFANSLAGKTVGLDRTIQEYIPGGRRALGLLNFVNQRVKANVILGNLGSTLAQLANIPNGIAFARQHSAMGAGRTLKSIFDKNAPVNKSPFMKERFGQRLYREFDERLIDQPKKFAQWLMEQSDRIGTSFIWNSAYQKALREGIENPVKYADDQARRLVGGRGIGETPIIQQSKVFQMLAPFQLEVANLWQVQKEFVKDKDAAGLMTLFLANFLLNQGMERVRGSGVTFDPIGAMIEAMREEEATPLERGGRLAGEVLSNLPLGQSVAMQYPEYGFEMAGAEFPSRQELFGDRDPTRFGSGILMAEAATKPLTRLVTPFGGNQLGKTIEGAQALRQQADYTPSDKFKFPVDRDPANVIRALAFGPSATSEARGYYNQDRRPLSENQTQMVEAAREAGADIDRIIDSINLQRDIQRLEREIQEIAADEELTPQQKRKRIQKKVERIREITNQR